MASPPTPLLTKIDDVARAQLSDGGILGTPAGTDSSSAVYTLEPGSGTGWRTARGPAVFAVTEGVLALQSAKGCTTEEYKAGQAAVVPPGRYLLANAGGEPREFAGVFVNLKKGGAEPLTDGTGESAPAGCKGASGYTAASTSGASVADVARGTMVPVAHYGRSVHALGAKGVAVEAGKDVLVSYYSVLPGFSSGWSTHMPAVAIVTRGTFTYYEDFGGGKCAKSEVYTPGQAYTHVGGFHLGANEGTEPADVTIVYFNLPHGGNGAVPVVGHTIDAVDFTPCRRSSAPASDRRLPEQRKSGRPRRRAARPEISGPARTFQVVARISPVLTRGWRAPTPPAGPRGAREWLRSRPASLSWSPAVPAGPSDTTTEAPT